MKTVALLFILFGSVHPTPTHHGVDGQRLIKTSDEQPAKWMTPNEIWSTLIANHANFMDITDHNFPPVKSSDTKEIPTTLKYQSLVPNITSNLNSSRISDFVLQFSTSFPHRYYASANGIASEQWLLGKVSDVVFNYTGIAYLDEFVHTWPQQRSIIVRIPGSDPNSTIAREVVVIGAHQDSINRDGPTLPAPGADDNASGSAVVLETLRALVQAGFVPRRTLEFHFFAAEEVGLLGSVEIAKSYFEQGVNVVSMLNFDVPGYFVEGNRTIRIATDHGSLALAEFITLLIDEYVELGWTFADCGYGCSDHASFHAYGFPATFPREPVSNPNMHTVNDVFARIDGDQIKEFAKLAVAYMVEMGEPFTA